MMTRRRAEHFSGASSIFYVILKKGGRVTLTFFSYVLLREHLGRRLTYLFLDICQPPSPKRVVFCWYHLLNIYVYGFADGKNYFGSRRDTQKSAKLASDSPQNCLAKIEWGGNEPARARPFQKCLHHHRGGHRILPAEPARASTVEQLRIPFTWS